MDENNFCQGMLDNLVWSAIDHESDNVRRRFCKVHNYEIKGLVWKSDLGLPNRKLTRSLLKNVYFA